MDSLDPGHLYLFQFPSPFPTFQPATTEQTVQAEGDVDLDANPDSSKREQGGKKVTFAEDVKSAASSSATTTTSQLPESQTQQTKAQVPLEGVIGQLEIRQSGAVQMRLSNNTVFDVCILFPFHLFHLICVFRTGLCRHSTLIFTASGCIRH